MTTETAEVIDQPIGTEVVDTEVDNIDSTDASDDTDEKSEKKTKKSGFEKRVGKLTAKVARAEADAAHWREEAQRQPVQQVQAITQDDKPKLAQYSNMEDYTEAFTDYKLAQRDNSAHQSKAQDAHKIAMDSYNERVKEFTKSKTDFADVLNDVSDMSVSNEITSTILESEAGPAIAYYLASNPEEIERLNALSPNRRLIELGKLEDKMVEKSAKKVKEVKDAPKPVSTVKSTTPAAPAAKSVYEMNSQELMRHRNATRGRGR